KSALREALQIRPDHQRGRFAVLAEMNIAHDADHGDVRVSSSNDAFADRVLPGPELSGDAFADHGDVRCTFPVCVRDRATTKDSESHHVEVIRAYPLVSN